MHDKDTQRSDADVVGSQNQNCVMSVKHINKNKKMIGCWVRERRGGLGMDA